MYEKASHLELQWVGPSVHPTIGESSGSALRKQTTRQNGIEFNPRGGEARLPCFRNLSRYASHECGPGRKSNSTHSGRNQNHDCPMMILRAADRISCTKWPSTSV